MKSYLPVSINIEWSNLGPVIISTFEESLCYAALAANNSVSQSDLRNELLTHFPFASENVKADPQLISETLSVIDGETIKHEIPTLLIGTYFQKSVWSALRRIPVGKRVSYSAVASMSGYPDAVRAVGTACKMNPVAVIVPCHRVINANGDFGNYRWGIDKKLILLQREDRFLKEDDQTIADRKI